MFGLLAVGAAKFASVGAVAQAVTGLGIALASVTGAAAGGVLPSGVQDHVSGVLEAVTPFDLPDSDDTSPTPAGEETASTQESPGDEVVNGPAQVPLDGETVPVLPEQAGFGQGVSSDAEDGGVDGSAVSSDAQEVHQPDLPGTTADQGSIPAPAAPELPDAGPPASAPVPAPAPGPADQASDHIATPPDRP